MKFRGIYFIVILNLVLLVMPVEAQESHNFKADSLSGTSSEIHALAFALNGNIIPHIQFSISPVVSLQLNHWSAQLRYNYEDIRTVSAAIGYRFLHEGDFWFLVTPKLAVAAGNFDGISPALSINLGYGPFSLLLDGEYAWSLDSASANYFFSWLEVTVDFNPFLYAGINAQRSKLFNTPNQVDGGLLVDFDPGNINIYAAAENFWNSSRYYIIGAGCFFDLGNKKKIFRLPALIDRKKKILITSNSFFQPVA
jgi:hypothetical protein